MNHNTQGKTNVRRRFDCADDLVDDVGVGEALSERIMAPHKGPFHLVDDVA
jgi:hypothetical protein